MNYTIAQVAPIALFPFFAFVINAFIVRKAEKVAVALSTIAIFLSFCFAARIFFDFIGVYNADYYVHKYFEWFDLNFESAIGLKEWGVKMGIYIDNMSAVMLLMVTGCATLIHLFSVYYMKGDSGGYGRFFVYLSLFTSAMLGLVLSDNLLSVFIFWEIMGFCSYSLIGFYNKKDAAGNASIKAFMTTRVGDVFFLLGILAIWHTAGSVDFPNIYLAISNGAFDVAGPFGMSLAAFAGICIFMGTIGKSAQFPLQVWLPDAMMGPTPCSALIHAATMVAAGVYLSLRMFPLMEAGDLTTFIAFIGAITAFGAATIALIQTDLKAVLAYSTISQLGYMVLGIGVGSYNAAFMHLITHAVFKACLFLSAGSVIHSLHDHHTHAHVQEMPRMGGLRHKMPFTWLAMCFCTLAIIGMPFFSGFVSKDRILGDALYWGVYADGVGLKTLVPILGFAGAVLTAFYMCRMMFLTFWGEPRDKEVYDHCHKEKFSFTRNLPLLILSVFTLGVFYSGSLTGQGFVKVTSPEGKDWFKTLIVKPNLEKFRITENQLWTDSFATHSRPTEKSVYSSKYSEDEATDHAIHHAHVVGAGMSVVIVFIGVFMAFMMYIAKKFDPGKWVKTFSWWYRWLQSKYGFDHLYIDVVIKKGLMKMNDGLAWFDMGVYDRIFIDGWEKVNRVLYRFSRFFDDKIIDKLGVDIWGGAVKVGCMVLRVVQSGKIQTYFMVLIFVLWAYVFFNNNFTTLIQ